MKSMRSLAELFAVASLALAAAVAPAAWAGSMPDGTPAPPAQRGVNIGSGPKAAATDEPVEQLQMSSDLLVFGRRTKDPVALIVAARVIKAVGGSEVDRKPERGKRPKPLKNPANPSPPIQFSARRASSPKATRSSLS